MEEIIFDKYMDIKHWASRMMEIYGPDEDVYVLIRNKQIIHYSLRDEFSDKILDNRYIIKKKAKLKCLLFISLTFELDTDDLIIFLLCYRQIHKVSNEELAAMLGLTKDNLIRIILGNKKVAHLDKINLCKTLNIDYLGITNEVKALFNC